MSAFMYTGQDN